MQSHSLFDAAHEPKRLVVFEGAGHVDLFTHDAALWERDVLAFLDDYRAPLTRALDPGRPK